MQSLLKYINHDKITELTDPDVIKLLDISKCINLRTFKCPNWFTDDEMKTIPKLEHLDLSDNDKVTEEGIKHLKLKTLTSPDGNRFKCIKGWSGPDLLVVWRETAAKYGVAINTSDLSDVITDTSNTDDDVPPLVEHFDPDCPIEQLITKRLSASSKTMISKKSRADEIESLLPLKLMEIIEDFDELVKYNHNLPTDLNELIGEHFSDKSNDLNNTLVEVCKKHVKDYVVDLEDSIDSINVLYQAFIDAINQIDSEDKFLQVDYKFNENISPVIKFFHAKFSKMGYDPKPNCQFRSDHLILTFMCDFDI